MAKAPRNFTFVWYTGMKVMAGHLTLIFRQPIGTQHGLPREKMRFCRLIIDFFKERPKVMLLD